MAQDKLKVGIVGGFQMGKSTLVNCLLDDKVAKTGGMGVAVTSIPTRYRFGEIQQVQYFSNGIPVHTCRLHEFLKDGNIPKEIDEVVVFLWKPILKYIDIVDTPGFKANDKDTTTTNEAINKLDFVVVLLNNKGLDNLESEVFRHLHHIGKPFIIVMNCMNSGGTLWDPNSEANKPIAQEILNRVKAIGANPIAIDGKSILICNLIWHWFASEHYLSDTIQQIQQIEMQTEFYFKNVLKILPNNYSEIVQRSNFRLIRQAFDKESLWGFPLNYLEWNSRLADKLSQWGTTINQALKKI